MKDVVVRTPWSLSTSPDSTISPRSVSFSPSAAGCPDETIWSLIAITISPSCSSIDPTRLNHQSCPVLPCPLCQPLTSFHYTAACSDETIWSLIAITISPGYGAIHRLHRCRCPCLTCPTRQPLASAQSSTSMSRPCPPKSASSVPTFPKFLDLPCSCNVQTTSNAVVS